MKIPDPIPCKYCGEPDDLSCSCTTELAFPVDVAGVITLLLSTLRAGYYVIDDGREPEAA
jgi:hypothetical protein